MCIRRPTDTKRALSHLESVDDRAIEGSETHRVTAAGSSDSRDREGGGAVLSSGSPTYSRHRSQPGYAWP